MLLGLRTVIYPAPDLTRAKQRYSELLGQPPYFDEAFYVGFSVGGGIRVSSVRDPFGNRLGLIQNPAFDAAKVR